MLINDHLHSRCSFDASYPLTEMCRAAEAAGIRRLCLTDHCDLVDEYGKPDDSFDWNEEEAELEAARRAFPQLDIRCGIELGQAILRPEAAGQVLSHPEIDFVLGSMHNSRLANRDFYWITCTSMAQCHALLEDYFQCLLALSQSDWMDALAHLTYPLRYLHPPEGEVSLSPFDDLIHEILQTLVHRGKALELNSSGNRQTGSPLLPESILRKYRSHGGELITIGSDAHEPAHIASGLEQGMALLRHCGFRYITLYRNRQPQPIPLG